MRNLQAGGVAAWALIILNLYIYNLFFVSYKCMIKIMEIDPL
jgi:hypothetical protein